jgi:beta-lactamase superfamily II metal-dependent hydrolase
MCCICLGFAFVSGAVSDLATIAALRPPATTVVVQLPAPKVEIVPTAIPVTQTQAPTSTFSPAPTVELSPIIPQDTPTAGPVLPVSGSLHLHFVDVGQGDATVIQTPNGQTVLIDGGETNTGIVQYLQSLGIQRIDLMIATHPHSDHIGGLVQVLQTFPVSKVVTNGQLHTTSTYEHFLDAIGFAQAEYVEVKRGDLISLDGITFHVLNPLSNSNSDLNENSVVLQFAYGSTTFLMMGDSGADTESALLSAGFPLKSTILKVGHHGSTSGSTQAFLNAVRPEIALYSAGIGNSYHHPAPQTIAALAAVGATVYGTDKNGIISVDVGPNGYTISTAKDVVLAMPAAPPIVPPTALPGSGRLEIISVTSPVSKGATATLTAKTSPGAACTITVYYKSGPSKASGLGSQTADASGLVSWTWKVGIHTSSGTWRIVVNCAGLTQETSFKVQ